MKPAPLELEVDTAGVALQVGTLQEVQSVSEFARHMEERGLLEWWRKGMSFTKDEI
jgi:hypothetical protein